jgi:hypothetical protein
LPLFLCLKFCLTNKKEFVMANRMNITDWERVGIRLIAWENDI